MYSIGNILIRKGLIVPEILFFFFVLRASCFALPYYPWPLKGNPAHLICTSIQVFFRFLTSDFVLCSGCWMLDIGFWILDVNPIAIGITDLPDCVIQAGQHRVDADGSQRNYPRLSF